jgi:polar amino acid transport system substrate-binding protein
VGVQVGSVAAMVISQRHVPTSTFGFEVDSLEALANHEIDAAAVTPTVAAYFNLTHPDKPVRILDLDESEANLNWNVAVGMVRPDEQLRDAIEGALERLRTNGTVDRIYRRYGIVLRPPR